MRIVLNIVAGFMLLLGLLWIGQGVNLIPGSFMTGDPQWALIGTVVAVVAVVILVSNRRASRRNP